MECYITHQNRTDSGKLVDHIEEVIDEIVTKDPCAFIVLAGDFNMLPINELECCTGLKSAVHQPTRGDHILDQILASAPCYDKVRVFVSTVKSDHRALLAENSICGNTMLQKKKVTRKFRQKTPAKNANFLYHLASYGFECNFDENSSLQTNFDNFYNSALSLLDQFYPEKSITLTNRDPSFVTPEIKSKLRLKNSLMKKGRIEQADAVARSIGKLIVKHNSMRFKEITKKTISGSKDLWTTLKKLSKDSTSRCDFEDFKAKDLNEHYCTISTDSSYNQPKQKSTCENRVKFFSEMEMFKILDSLKHTATGVDAIPAWFLRLGAPLFSLPLALLFNQSIKTSVVPVQWKKALIFPHPKVNCPKVPSDFRPISITSVLSRVMEKQVVRKFIYPAILDPPPSLSFKDQFAFRPTGSTTAALITLLSHITRLLESNPYVLVYALDFSKAFDTVRHSTLLAKVAKLTMPDEAYNWIVDYFQGHSHCTAMNEELSEFLEISASVIQGSGIGPGAYSVNASDLKAVHEQNLLVKYADDTYLVVAASSESTCTEELTNIKQWAEINNLTLNEKKSVEIVFYNPRARQYSKSQQPPPTPFGFTRMNSLRILGVTLKNNFSMTEHIGAVVSSCSQALYAMKILKSQGLGNDCLHIIYQTTILSKLLYASQAWIGFASEADIGRMESFRKKSIKFGFASPDLPLIRELCERNDKTLFKSVIQNENHVLRGLLPARKEKLHNVRPRTHEFIIPTKSTKLDENNFFKRMLFRKIY